MSQHLTALPDFREARRMNRQVFISYARGTSRTHAEALHQALGADVAFLDTSGVEAGGRFPAILAEALLGALIIVVFVDETYFTRWYCLWELRTALAPFLALPPGASESDKALALAPLVLALPPEGGAASLLERLPPRLRELQWPGADQTERLVQWIRAGLEGERLSVGARLERLGRLEETRARLLQESVLPPPETLAGLRLHPLELPPSIGASFVGREDDLWRIDFALTASHAGERTAAALSGALEAGGGFGKTRLALEYLHRLGPRRFPGGLFWVDADVSEERMEEQHHGILRTLRPEVPPLPEFRKQQREAARELAEALHGLSAREPVLYVVDNVPEPGPGQRPRPLKTWCPALGKVALLVTSRARFSLGTESVQAIPVPTLAPDAAGALLTERVLEARLRFHGEENPETLHSMSNLATILWDQGDVQGSRSFHERVLAIRRRTPPEAGGPPRRTRDTGAAPANPGRGPREPRRAHRHHGLGVLLHLRSPGRLRDGPGDSRQEPSLAPGVSAQRARPGTPQEQRAGGPPPEDAGDSVPALSRTRARTTPSRSPP